MRTIVLFFIILMSLIGIASAGTWNTTGYEGQNWDGNSTTINMTTEPTNVVLGISADYYNRADNNDVNANTGKTKWWDSAYGTIWNNTLSSQDWHAFMVIDQDISNKQNYSFSFKLLNDSWDNFQIFFFYQPNNSQTGTAGYQLRWKWGTKIQLNYYNSTLIEEASINYAIGDIFLVNTSTISTGLKLYQNGVLIHTYPANSEYNNGSIAISCAPGAKMEIIDDYRVWRSDVNNGNVTCTIFDSEANNKTSKIRIHGNNPIAGANVTVAINKSTDNSNWVWEQLGVVTTVGDFNVTYDVTGVYRYVSWDFYAQTNNSSQTSVIYNGSLYYEAAGPPAPNIASYAPTVTTWPEVADSQIFNITVDQSVQCRWYINGSLEQTNSTPSTTHSYTNTSLKGGHWNFTAVVNNTNGTDSQTWLFEVGADSITYIVLQDQPTNKSMILELNVTRIGSNVTDWGLWLNHTYNGWDYTFRYTNGTAIKSLTASSDNESLWFNRTTLLPTGVYFINATEAVNTSTIIIPTNSWGMANNWTTATNFSNIAANESNDVAYSYYNVSTGKWESHYPLYSWNSDYVIPLEASVMVFVNAVTTVTAYTVTPVNTNLFTGWNQLFVMGTDNETIADIKSDIGANCTAVWAYNSTAGAYTNSLPYSVQPCQGVLVYITQDMLWVRSDL